MKKANLRKLVKSYAMNRMAEKAILDKIRALGPVDLQAVRDAWYQDGKNMSWFGWVEAVNDCPFECGHKEKSMAVLLDEKAKARQECGNIRRRIYKAGVALFEEDEAMKKAVKS